MGIYASSHACGTQRVDVVSMGAISAPLLSLAQDQFFTARAAPGPVCPAKGQGQPIAVHSSTSVPSGQRT
jgi:hypothetical protein